MLAKNNYPVQDYLPAHSAKIRISKVAALAVDAERIERHVQSHAGKLRAQEQIIRYA